MTIAAKHLDPIMGIDTHIVMIPSPAGPIPTPLPNPYVGMVMDPFDYIPVLGATVFINGLPRAQAGTGGIALVPHLPLGGPLAPPPTNESEVFMGSATVCVDGDAQSFLGLLVLSCQSVGMPAPPRPKGQPPKSLVLPTSAVLSIPMGMPVMIGGPPTISLMSLAMAGAMKALGKLGGLIRRVQRADGVIGRAMRRITEAANDLGRKLADRLHLGNVARQRIRNAICTVTGHPVDVATGRVFTEQTDFELPGPIPFAWKRSWSSTSTYHGDLGHGWHHPYQHALYVNDDVVLYRDDEGRAVAFPPVKLGKPFFLLRERLTLERTTKGYSLHTAERLTYRFTNIGRPENEWVLSAIENIVGDAIVLRYDSLKQLNELTDSAGRRLCLQRDHVGRVRTLDAPHPDAPEQRVVVARYAYDDRGNLVEVVDALGAATRFEYRGHLLAKETNRNGLSFHFEYDGTDEHARCLRTWGDGGIYDHKLSYDDALGITTVVDSLGHAVRYEHQDGQVLRTVDPLGGVTERVYDEDNQLLAEQDPLGRRTSYTYDARGNMASVLRPDGTTLEASYNEQGLLLQALDALQQPWAFRYDAVGRLLERTDPLGHTTQYRYDGRRLGQVINPAGSVTAVEYDSAGSLRGLLPPDGTRTSWDYDGWGRPVASEDPNRNRQRRVYDLLSRVVRVQEPDGNIRELQYDAEGNALRVNDQQHDVRFTYQGMGRLASRSEAGTVVRFEYDTEEQLTGVVNEHGYVYRFELGPMGDIMVESGFDAIRRRYERDVAGQVQALHRHSGLVSHYRYDPAGRVVAVDHTDGSKERYAYRADGELLQAENDSALVKFERDALGRVLKETQGDHWVASRYDALGQRSQMASSLGAKLYLQRNAMGDVMELAEAGGFAASFARDRLGLEIARELPGGMRSAWRRDDLGRPLQHDVTSPGTRLRSVGYNWEANDRLRRVVDTVQGAVNYGHDELGNLAWAAYADGTRELRVPDAVGNLFKSEDRSDRKYGPGGQLLQSRSAQGTTRYSYDAEGNLSAKREPSGRIWRYAWGADGMLRAVTRPDGSEVTFEYDALGRRIKKHYRGQTTSWIWDGNVPLHEWVDGKLQPLQTPDAIPIWVHDAAIKHREAELQAHLQRGPPERGSTEAPITWLFEPESFAPMARLQGGQAQSIVCDYLGTPVLMTDEDGRKTWAATLSTWGESRSLDGERLACPFRWPGQYEDAETGLYYNRFRYYDPEAGAYISQDPIRLWGGAALYAYVADPTYYVDSLGLHTILGWVNGEQVRRPLGQSGESSPLWVNNPGSGSNSMATTGLGRAGDSENLFMEHLEDTRGREGLSGSWVEIESIRSPQGSALPPCDLCSSGMQNFADRNNATVVYRVTEGRGPNRRVKREFVFRPNAGCG